MNEKEPIKIRLSTLLIIIFIIVILIMGYYIYYLSQEKNIIAKDLENTKNMTLEPQAENKEIADEEKSDDKKVTNEKDAFEVYQEGYEKSFKEKINGYNKIDVWLYDYDIPKGLVSAYVDANHDAYVRIDTDSEYAKYGETMKVDENIANIYVCHTGNGSWYDIIFLRKDGTASKINFEKYLDGIIECNEISNIKGAVNVISFLGTDGVDTGGASDYYFIDIYGNIVE